MLFISCRKTHQSQSQVTFLKTVPLFLQGYTYYLKRVMIPMLVPACSSCSFFFIAFSFCVVTPKASLLYKGGAVGEQNRKVCHSDIAVAPDTGSDTAANSSECTHISQQGFPQITLPSPPGRLKLSCVISDLSICLVE